MNVHTFKKIGDTKDENQQFRIRIQFNKDNCTLVVFENSNAWKAEVSWNEITKLADQFELNTEEYYGTLKQYVVDTPANVELKVANNEFICYCKENGINLKYFSCKLKKIGFKDHVYDLLDEFFSEAQKIKQEMTEMKFERDILSEERQQLKEKLTNLVERKAQEEQELLSKFVLVLNEKKRRIQHLNQTLHAFKAGRPILNPEIKLTKPIKNEVKKKVDTVSDSDSSNNIEEYNTDDDDEKPKNNEDIPDEMLPSTSKKHNFNAIFSDSDDTIDLPKRKKLKNEHEEEISTFEVQNKNIESEVAGSADAEEGSPKISFNTQDLLDCI